MKKYEATWNFKKVDNSTYNAKIKAIVKLNIPKKFQENFRIKLLLNGMEFVP